MEPVVVKVIMITMGLVHLVQALHTEDSNSFVQADIWIVGSLIIGALT